jgi:dephospho-CoA kinase
MKIIGITGPAAAGKWTVVEYLKELWFSHYSASGFLTQELEKQGKEVNRDTMRELADSLRAQYGPSYVI